MIFGQKEKFMIVGLGNPGKKYEKTRHNAGWMALDILEAAYGASSVKSKKTAEIKKASRRGQELYFVRPLTFMNLSGGAVNEVGSFYKIPKENIIVIADDVSMDVGRLRLRDKGSDGGHNGLKDIIRVLGGNDFIRIKIGVGQKPHPEYDLADWVLGRFSKEDEQKLKETMEPLPDCLELLLNKEFAKAQNQYNR